MFLFNPKRLMERHPDPELSDILRKAHLERVLATEVYALAGAYEMTA